MNAKALKLLEKRAEERVRQSAAARVKVDEAVERFRHGVGQNPKLTKYKLPNIEDLVSYGR